MSLTTYTELKEEIATWLARGDTGTTAGGADTYIDLCEAWLNRNLRCRSMVTAVGTLTVSATGAITHPTNWLEWKSVDILGQPMTHLPPVTEEGGQFIDASNAVGYPQALIVRGSYSQVWPAPDATYTYRGIYYRSIPALTATTGETSNWVLQSYPDIYLYGSLLQASARLVGDERIPLWQAAFDRALNEMQREDDRANFGGGPLTPQVQGVI